MALNPAKVLVVDDERPVADLLVDILELEGFVVDVAHDGAEALVRIEHRAYDAILLDTRMPVLDGLSLYDVLQRRDAALLRRVAFMTGDLMHPERGELIARTGAAVLAKPFAVDEVIALVHRLVEQS